MRNPLRFFVELMKQPVWVTVWVFFLIVINVASLGFWHEPVAKLIFITFIISVILMMGLYSKYGFEKILGLGHILWIPLLVYVLMQIPAVEFPFRSYLFVFSVLIAISLVFDIIDVWKYFRSRKII